MSQNFLIHQSSLRFPKVNLAIFASIVIVIIIISSIFLSQPYSNGNYFNSISPFQFTDVPINHSSHKRVFIIGIDGIGTLPATQETPGIYRIINNGIYTFHATTVFPSLSAESWTSLLHGVSPLKHQILTENPPKKPFPANSSYPSIFRVLHEQNNKSVMAVFSNWYFIPKFIVEDGIGVQKFWLSEKNIIKNFEKFMQTNDPTLVFFQLDDTDVAGHRFGFYSEDQIKQLFITDQAVNKIIDIIEKYDPNNESLILIQTDHGGSGINPHMHGSDDFRDMLIFWTVRGKGICKNKIIDQHVSIVDTARFVASYLNLKIPESWEGENLFSKYLCK